MDFDWLWLVFRFAVCSSSAQVSPIEKRILKEMVLCMHLLLNIFGNIIPSEKSKLSIANEQHCYNHSSSHYITVKQFFLLIFIWINPVMHEHKMLVDLLRMFCSSSIHWGRPVFLGSCVFVCQFCMCWTEGTCRGVDLWPRESLDRCNVCPLV